MKQWYKNNWRNKAVITPNSFEYLILVVSDSKSFFLCGAGEDLSESLGQQEIKPVDLKKNQLWIFFGRADAETLMLWPPDAKNWLTGKEPDAGKDWGKEEEGVTEDEIVGWHHRLNGHEFKQILGDGEGEGSLACCGSWGHKELDTT